MVCCVGSVDSTDPTQETCATVDHAGYTGPTRQHELDHTDHTDRIDQTKYLDRQVGADDLPEERKNSKESLLNTVTCSGASSS